MPTAANMLTANRKECLSSLKYSEAVFSLPIVLDQGRIVIGLDELKSETATFFLVQISKTYITFSFSLHYYLLTVVKPFVNYLI